MLIDFILDWRGPRPLGAVISLLLLCGPWSVASAGDPLGLDDGAPRVRFDLPRTVAASMVEPCKPLPTGPQGKLLKVTIPVSLRLLEGDINRVIEIAIEVDGEPAGLVVYDFAPKTTLVTDHADKIEVTKTTENGKTLSGTLGGQVPIPSAGPAAQVTPSISAAKKNSDLKTVRTSHLPPHRPLAVSGTMNQGRGAFFQLRPSTQSTLEGQHQFTVVFRVPEDYAGGKLEVACLARGMKKVFWVEQSTTWTSLRTPVQVVVAPAAAGKQPPSHVAAKPVVSEAEVKAESKRKSETPSQKSAAALQPGKWIARNQTVKKE